MVIQTIQIILMLTLGFVLGIIYQRRIDGYKYGKRHSSMPAATVSDKDIERVIRKVKEDMTDHDIRTYIHDDAKTGPLGTFLSVEDARQLKLSQDDYAATFLQAPRIEDRKPVFVSCEVRDRLDEIVRRVGSRRLSVSGILENMARHHLDLYKEVIGGLYNRQGIIKFN